MSSLHADYYADQLVQHQTELVENEAIAESTYRLRVACPSIAQRCVPGQFVMIRLADVNAPLIGRAFAIWDVIADSEGTPTYIDLIYLKKGSFTTACAESPVGTRVSLWGPLGNGFSNQNCDRLIMAVGGIGQTPMLLLGREALGQQSFDRESGWAKHAEVIYGARRQSLHAGVDQFRSAGFDVHLCTDDGSAGTRALVPDVLAERLKETDARERVRVVTCGPEIMMEKVAEVCAALRLEGRDVHCQVSMETPMACGIGICFSCVAKVKQDDGEWDYKRTCVEGPIFDAEKIVW
ncbi:dihydroorotate dehydrogenase electron transfer subunit [Roseiconus lacunae]|uniref:Dihydroorotate dehydrogenase electron transfer subunit n=1 Tax=Roseiconus lacunae TaxID=2605694 RepID=A0ABT7PR79_9BACT|nr:dihydroorotate dehydrogenase electron transfer subunit [Roseiconus lacunae]MCD0460351.1 dihydroorotate dehydrogenase electron transfer subunit [Roseiconus lacunae]MDM4019020.1 dihydroorotate dehydrogenase electron transfer subunit [Roseiconus lacunae]